MKEENKEEIILNDGYKTIEFKTLKGGLIQVIIYTFLEPFLFKNEFNIDEFSSRLREILDKNLNFQTEVFIELNEEGLLGSILYEGDNGKSSVAFHVLRSGVNFENENK
jgi:hypothetical protein